MSVIIIDYDNIISDDLKTKLNQPPKSSRGFVVGLILIVSDMIVSQLSELPLGAERVRFIHKDRFIQHISAHYYVLYNQKRGICIIEEDIIDYVQPILQSCFSGFPTETVLWISLNINSIEFIDKLQILINNGFNHPYITSTTPQFVKTQPSLALIRPNIGNLVDINRRMVLNSVLHLMRQYKENNKTCFLQAKFSAKAIEFLRNASHVGVVIEKGEKTQREITGELLIQDVINQNDKIVYIIDVAESSVQSGDEENVDVNATRYNFHSHPREAYVRHNVEKAWPSSTDYLGYYQLGHNTIFHCVATIEGIYILSFSPHWAHQLKKVDRNFISEHYDIDHSEPLSPEEYVEKVNSILYKGFPVYEVKFFRWQNADTPFKVFFPQIGSTCLVSQDTVDNHKKLHSAI